MSHFPFFLFTHRIHGSVDCLSELSSSRLSHPLSGESAAFIASFDWDLFEMCLCIYYAVNVCGVILMQESVWEYMTLVIAVQGQSVAVSARHRPSQPQRRPAEEVLLPGVSLSPARLSHFTLPKLFSFILIPRSSGRINTNKKQWY